MTPRLGSQCLHCASWRSILCSLHSQWLGGPMPCMPVSFKFFYFCFVFRNFIFMSLCVVTCGCWYALRWIGRMSLGPVNNATYLVSGTTILMCPSLPPPFPVKMATNAAVNCIVSLLMLLSVSCPPILAIHPVRFPCWLVLFNCLKQISLRLLDNSKRDQCA